MPRYSPYGDIADLFPNRRGGGGGDPLRPATGAQGPLGSPQMPMPDSGGPPTGTAGNIPDLGQVPAVPPAGAAPAQPIDREALINLLAQRLHPMRGFGGQ